MQVYAEVLEFIDPPLPGRMDFGKESDEGDRSGLRETRKVLVVDDESNIADTLVEILKGEGYQAIAASTGDSAIELAQAFRPDIVISDVVIPGPNGVEAGIKIRELLPECRIILFSGQTATVDLLREARERGHDFEIVAKPIKPETLLSMLQRPRGN